MTTQTAREVGWSFWSQWVIANVVAWIIGAALITPVANIILGVLAAARIMYFSYELPSSYTDGSMIGGAIYGVLIGVLQWLVLRRCLYRLSLAWVLASTLGWTLGAGILAYGAAALSNDLLAPGVRGVIFGAMAGASQWLVLRRYSYHAGWWIVAVSIGWSLSSLAYFLFGVLLGPALTNIELTVLGGINGVAFGMITGFTMMWLLNHPKQQMING